MKQMIVNIMPEEVRMAIIEDCRMIDFSMERCTMEHVVNRIYKAAVRNVLPGMAAAFVDIGRAQNAYLNLKQGKQAKKIGRLTQGQSLLVQVVKEEMDNKAARVTTDISFAGRYMVFLPYSEGIHISKKLGDEALRARLKEWAEPFATEGGFIFRTAAKGATAEEILYDLEYLRNTWVQVKNRFSIARGVSELYRDADFAFRLARDYITPEIEEVVVDDEETCQRLQELLQHSSLKNRVSYYNQGEPIFKQYDVEACLDSLVQSEVPLPSGGRICIDRTEAMTVIDVNSGQYTGRSHNPRETALVVNKEAAVEICRQLRLRDIGGVIIVDFIDMPTEEQKKELYKVLYEQVKLDHVRIVLREMTSLGLVEMTRKRERQGIQEIMFDTCSCCGGTGYLLSAETIYIQILRRLRELGKSRRLHSDILLEVHRDVAAYFTKEVCRKLGEELSRGIKVEVGASGNREAYAILSAD